MFRLWGYAINFWRQNPNDWNSLTTNKEIFMLQWFEKQEEINNFNVRNITANKQFWKTVKPFFSNKLGGNKKSNFNKIEKISSGEQRSGCSPDDLSWKI